MIAYPALIVAAVGLVLYLIASNPKQVEIGRILFFVGMLVFTMVLGGHAVRVFGP
jgi:Na+/phosphate symporter